MTFEVNLHEVVLQKQSYTYFRFDENVIMLEMVLTHQE